MIKLRPINDPQAQLEQVETAIITYLRKVIYIPLMERLTPTPTKALANSKSSLLDAILSGRINFYRGHFKGRFNATLSREIRALGALWDRKQGSWKIPHSKLPVEVRMTISLAAEKLDMKVKEIDRILEAFVPEKIAYEADFTKQFANTIWKVSTEFDKSIKGITVAPVMTDQRVADLARDYGNNMELYIKDFTEKEIKRLRVAIQDSALKGFRYEGMIKEIQKSYGVSHRKAKFLARQETNIMVAKFTESRYQEAGVDDYIWRCVTGTKKHPVRPMHKALDGTRQKFSDPPVVNEKGDRKNPKCDYGCRCQAIPIVRFGK